jgi:hypothetical protein
VATLDLADAGSLADCMLRTCLGDRAAASDRSGISAEVIGGTGGLAIDEGGTKFSSPLVAQRPNTDATGRPCLNVHASAEKQTINTMIYNHILLLDNVCTKEIRLRACYYKSDSCQEITVRGNNRQRYVFGVFTTPDFRFSYREYVN